jgi:hypothetical protein
MRLAVILISLGLSGCVTDEIPSRETFQCNTALSRLSNPYFSYAQKMEAYDIIESRCPHIKIKGRNL